MDPYPLYIPPVALTPNYNEDGVNPRANDSLDDEKNGLEQDAIVDGSDTFMEKQGTIVAHRRTDYSEDQLGCGSKFSTLEHEDKGGRC